MNKRTELEWVVSGTGFISKATTMVPHNRVVRGPGDLGLIGIPMRNDADDRSDEHIVRDVKLYWRKVSHQPEEFNTYENLMAVKEMADILIRDVRDFTAAQLLNPFLHSSNLDLWLESVLFAAGHERPVRLHSRGALLRPWQTSRRGGSTTSFAKRKKFLADFDAKNKGRPLPTIGDWLERPDGLADLVQTMYFMFGVSKVELDVVD